jgi:hypothetical protein
MIPFLMETWEKKKKLQMIIFVDFANKRIYDWRTEWSWYELGIGKWSPNENVQFGITKIITKVVRRIVHRRWWLHGLDSVCWSRGSTNNLKSCKQVFWIFVTTFSSTAIRKKTI